MNTLPKCTKNTIPDITQFFPHFGVFSNLTPMIRSVAPSSNSYKSKNTHGLNRKFSNAYQLSQIYSDAATLILLK
jgi:hypothetical protein